MRQVVRKLITAAATTAALALPQVSLGAYGDTGSLTMLDFTPSEYGYNFQLAGYFTTRTEAFSASYDRNFAAAPAPASFVAYCVDIVQDFSWGVPFAVTETNPVSLFGAFRADALNRLYSNYFKSSTTADKSAAFQLAVWEIATEANAQTYAQFGLGTGDFRVVAGDNAIRTTADNWLHGLGALEAGGYALTVLASPTFQDQMMATPVPEPSTYMMLLSGLGLMGFVVRRRQRSLAG